MAYVYSLTTDAFSPLTNSLMSLQSVLNACFICNNGMKNYFSLLIIYFVAVKHCCGIKYFAAFHA